MSIPLMPADWEDSIDGEHVCGRSAGQQRERPRSPVEADATHERVHRTPPDEVRGDDERYVAGGGQDHGRPQIPATCLHHRLIGRRLSGRRSIQACADGFRASIALPAKYRSIAMPMHMADNATIIRSAVHALGHTDAIQAKIRTSIVLSTVAMGFSPSFTMLNSPRVFWYPG
jgi:hypothetical protein